MVKKVLFPLTCLLKGDEEMESPSTDGLLFPQKLLTKRLINLKTTLTECRNDCCHIVNSLTASLIQ